MFAVSVTFQTKTEELAAFLPLVRQQAENSLRLEGGCRQFDVWTDEASPAAVFLYETYDDATAFDLHLASDHFRAFSTATANMVTGKTVQTWNTKI